MNKLLHISTMLDQPALLEDMIEKLAYRRNDIGYSYEILPYSHKAIETSSTETFVSGTISIEDNEEMINMPFITRFVFTCVKGKNDPYKLAWSSSLS